MACGFVCLFSAVLTSEWPCYTNEKSSDVKSSLLAKCCGQSNGYVACPNGRWAVLFEYDRNHIKVALLPTTVPAGRCSQHLLL
ncbi:hypothetical protein Zmor_009409 [Zophobas morio]|uniref:Secreted protein n=1 Tax=Zophobas morio TaxID=2755281 RepID=A0AA38MIN2_9CUCU|nr:hypothetical protein Zmor_009409 [Zophobas morio]